MTRRLDRLAQVASHYDAVVLDQWGVLHDGSAPYPTAVEGLSGLSTPLAVLSNSGKRSAPNAVRITQMGFGADLFALVMTSGEALWQDIRHARVPHNRLFAVERTKGDAAAWAEGLDVTLTDLQNAEGVLLMGLPDGDRLSDWQDMLAAALARDLPILCSNPDRSSPRADGLVISPGALAFAYRDMGGSVTFYGKPHRPVFDAVARDLGTTRLLMVGDSLEHDIAGAQGAGWDSLLVTGGLYAQDFATEDHDTCLARLIADKGCAPPTYSMEALR